MITTLRNSSDEVSTESEGRGPLLKESQWGVKDSQEQPRLRPAQCFRGAVYGGWRG